MNGRNKLEELYYANFFQDLPSTQDMTPLSQTTRKEATAIFTNFDQNPNFSLLIAI